LAPQLFPVGRNSGDAKPAPRIDGLNDDLFQQISEMLAGFRRHFPVYSPRYNAHMTADQTIPSILGYFAGMLYNPNNVTPEAAPVTVQWSSKWRRYPSHARI